jgi:class 3 adenylate cyclase
MLKKYYHKIVELGITNKLSETNKRQVRSTNIATIMSVLFLISWIPFAFILQDTPIPNFINLLGVLFFLPVFLFNKSGKRALAAIWLILTSYFYIILNLLLYGYESGVPLIFVVLIPIPFLTIPHQRRILSFSLSLIVCITWICIVSFKSHFPPNLEGADYVDTLQVNTIFIALLLLIMFFNFSGTISRAEASLQLEREKSDSLLHNILPHFIAKRLKEKQGIIADGIPMASVLFADLVGFTKLSEKLSPQHLVNQLNEVFSKFDRLTEKYRLEKIKTIGDAYMVSGGLHENKNEHLTRMTDMALEMLEFISVRNKKAKYKFEIRVGIHIGPVVAGVIGIKKFAYDIWGDTVNLASRMESHGVPGRIHVSEQVKVMLDKKFDFELRGEIEIKGKGPINTYFLNKRKATNTVEDDNGT